MRAADTRWVDVDDCGASLLLGLFVLSAWSDGDECGWEIIAGDGRLCGEAPDDGSTLREMQMAALDAAVRVFGTATRAARLALYAKGPTYEARG